MNEPTTVVITSEKPVIIEKLYGPTIFMDLMIEIDTQTVEWVVYRHLAAEQWIEWCRIPGQMDEDFDEDE